MKRFSVSLFLLLYGGCVNFNNAACGNGIPDDGEECDDANNIDGDGCQADCSLSPSTCGNRAADPGESCFEAPPTLFSAAPLLDGTLVDLNGDGLRDLLIADGDGTLGAIVAVGGGLFNAFAPVVSLYVNDYNRAAQQVYARCGFRRVGTFATVLF